MKAQRSSASAKGSPTPRGSREITQQKKMLKMNASDVQERQHPAPSRGELAGTTALPSPGPEGADLKGDAVRPGPPAAPRRHRSVIGGFGGEREESLRRRERCNGAHDTHKPFDGPRNTLYPCGKLKTDIHPGVICGSKPC